MERYVGNIRLVEYDILLKHREVYAFSTYRQGGVSTGAYASLNCTPYVDDDPQCVRQNQEILLNTLPHRPCELVTPWQTHGTDILTVDEDWLVATPERRHHLLQGIDAMITDKPGVCLCVSTADCIPILLYDHVHRVIAAVHAGWRGTVNFLVLRTLRRMHEYYGTEAFDVLACIRFPQSRLSHACHCHLRSVRQEAPHRFARSQRHPDEVLRHARRLYRRLPDLHLQAARRLLLRPSVGGQVGAHPVGHHAARITVHLRIIMAYSKSLISFSSTNLLTMA